MYLIKKKIITGEYALAGYCNSFKDALSIADKVFENGFGDIIIERYKSGGTIKVYVNGRRKIK